MKRFFERLLTIVVASSFALVPAAVFAEGTQDKTNISISPASRAVVLESSKVYEDTLSVTNNGDDDMKFEVHASPYSYTRVDENSAFQLGFEKETAYTQITRWITFQNTDGAFVENAQYVATPHSTVDVVYRITAPESVPTGGQYAVIFAHVLSPESENGGIRTEASPGMIIYGRSVGKTLSSAVIKDLSVKQSVTVDGATKGLINGSALVANTGNIDFVASGALEVTGLFGDSCYKTGSDRGLKSIIPETELAVSDTWDDTPYFGIFNVTWTVTAAGETSTITSVIFIIPPFVIVITILLLTILTICVIMVIRKRKERQ